MPAPLTNEEFAARMRAVHGTKIQWKGSYQPKRMSFYCTTCKNRWMTDPGFVYRGADCPKCAAGRRGKPRKTQNEYVTELRARNPLLRCVDAYDGIDTKINHRCMKCNHIFSITPYNAINDGRCFQCLPPEATKWTDATYKRRVSEVHAGKVRVLTKYTRSQDYSTFQCTKCDRIWKTKAYSVIAGHGCSTCKARSHSRYSVSSKEVAWLSQLRDQLRLTITTSVPIESTSRKPYILDGYSHRKQVAFEFLGDYWHAKGDTNHQWHIRTQAKFSHLLSKGLAVVFIWEGDYKANKKPCAFIPKQRTELIAWARKHSFRYKEF